MKTKLRSLFCAWATVWLSVLGLSLSLYAAEWPPTVHLLALDQNAAEEGSDTATFAVVRIGENNAALTVQYVLGGGANNGVDYDFLTGEVTIPAGAWFAPIVVTPVDDFDVEGLESVVVALEQPAVWPPPYIVSWPSVAFAQIADNDLPPTNQPPSVALVRPPDGSIFEAGDDILMVARASDSDGRIRTVQFLANGVSLGIVTNLPSPGWVGVLDGDADPTFDADDLDLPDPDAMPGPVPGQLFRLVWDGAKPGDYILTAVATDNDGATKVSLPVQITVLEPPPMPVVNVLTKDPIAREPNPVTPGVDTATFTIYRKGPTNEALRVFYRLTGTAQNGVDYRELPHSAIILAGERSVDVIVMPLDDSLVEGPEGVILTLLPPVAIDAAPPADGYIVGPAHTAKAAILDNDLPNRPPLVRLVKPENGDVFLAPANIRLAALARDFDGRVVTVEFFEGTNSLGIVTNNPATAVTARPAFTMVWSNVPPGHYVLTAVATDNGGASTQSRPAKIKVVPHVVPPVVNIFATDPDAAETLPTQVPNPAVFTVTRTAASTVPGPLLVFYSIGGTASNGVDYTLLSGHVLIPANSASATITVQPIDDRLVEGLETVVLKLEPSPIVSTTAAGDWWYRIGSNSVARALIRDNEIIPVNWPPKVALVRPEEGDIFEAPVDIPLVAEAGDRDGWVKTVEFFAGNVSLGIVTNSPSSVDPSGAAPESLFRLLWKNAVPGTHVLTAKATDNLGATATSAPVTIKVLPPPLPPVVTIYATDPIASEGGWPETGSVRDTSTAVSHDPGTATFSVFRRGDVSVDLTVYYRLEGTARNGVDYRQLSGRVVIPRGATRAPIYVVPVDDSLPEPTETVIATLVPIGCITVYPPPPDCYIVGDPSTARAIILDNDLNLAPKAEIVQPANGDVFRAYSDIDISVLARDPDGWVTKMLFYANNQFIGEQSMIFIVPPPPGQPQRFGMTWSNVPPGNYTLTARAIDNLGAMSTTDPVHIRVIPIQPLPVVTITTVDRIATEPNPTLPVLPDTAKFMVQRSVVSPQPLTVFYRIAGTAANGLDYRTLPGMVTIPANAPTAPIEIVPLYDTLVEGTESVILTLVQPPCITSNSVSLDCYFVGQPSRDIAFIRDNNLPPNLPPKVQLVSPPNGAEYTAPLDLRLVAGAVDADGWVESVEFFDGTVSLGIVSNRAWIVESPLVRLSNLGTEVVSDQSPERPFVLPWRDVPVGRHILSAVATDNCGATTRSLPVEITVHPPSHLPIVNLRTVDGVAREGTTNTAAFRIRRAGDTNAPLTVFYTIHGTAVNGTDYVTIPGYATIPAGRRSVRVTITPIDDNLLERAETVVLRLTDPPSGAAIYEIGRPARAAALILDNDHPLLPTRALSDGRMHMRLEAADGMPFRLEASTDLINWETVVDSIVGEDGVSFTDDEATGLGKRFFRLVPEFGDAETDD